MSWKNSPQWFRGRNHRSLRTTKPLLGNLHRADVLMRQANGITRILEVGITSCFATNLNVQNWEPGVAAGMMEIEKHTDFARELLAE